MTSDGAHMSTSTTKQGIKQERIKVKFQDEEVHVTSNEELDVETPANSIIIRSSMDSLPNLKLDTFVT